MSKLNWAMTTAGASVLLAAATVALSAQTLTTLHSFNQTDGSNPYAGLMQASNGILYGTTSAGGANGDGTVFQITTSGTLTTMHNFNHLSPTDGAQPYSGLIQARDGNLYGTTYRGGSHNVGIAYRISLGGTMTALHDLDYQPDGALPYAGLVQASNGNFYGTASNGGGEFGTAFVVTAFSQFTPIYTFINSFIGANPVAGLVQASNGNLYGAADSGGSDGCGALFEMTLSGAYTMLHDFTGDDGCSPQATLVQGSDGNLYGTTIDGGAGGQGHNYGAAFKMTPSGAFTLLHTFDGTDGTLPTGAIIQATDGNFYGTTQYGGL
jgi:uncharacterized repeat protein (TIGR03803 family)